MKLVNDNVGLGHVFLHHRDVACGAVAAYILDLLKPPLGFEAIKERLQVLFTPAFGDVE